MKAKDLLMLDSRKEGTGELLLEFLQKTPLFKGVETITTDELEKVIRKIQRKYPVILSYITQTKYTMDDEDEPEIGYSFMCKRTDDHTHIKTVYALTLHEGLSKVIVLLYSFIKSVLQKEE